MSTTPTDLPPSTFTHTPRPAILPSSAAYSYQRRFGPGVKTGNYSLEPWSAEGSAMSTRIHVYRDAGCDVAEVSIGLGVFTCAEITARLSAAELRDLAARLVDAAHDIDTLPAAVLAQAQKGGAA